MKPLWQTDIKRDVQYAKWGLTALIAVFGFAFMYFIGEFKDVRKDISSIQASQAAQTVTVGTIRDTLSKIDDKLEKMNADAQAGPRSGQAKAVRDGARPRL